MHFVILVNVFFFLYWHVARIVFLCCGDVYLLKFLRSPVMLFLIKLFAPILAYVICVYRVTCACFSYRSGLDAKAIRKI